VVVAVGETVMEAEALPLLQEYEVPPLAVRDAPAPIQMEPSLLLEPDDSTTVMVGVGSGVTVTERVEVAVQPLLLVAVTV
jgi:hypothetical protein